MEKRGWTEKQIDEALGSEKTFQADNKSIQVSATRHPTTGKSVVIDDVTGEILQMDGDGFKF